MKHFPFSNLSVLWLNEIGKRLRLALIVVNAIVISVVAVAVGIVVTMWVFCWADVLHLVDRAALWAALDWAFARGLRKVRKWADM